MSACGQVGWCAGTGRPDLRFSHQRLSQYMANPTRGALKAAVQVIRYASATRDLCLMQPKGSDHRWCHYSDSDHAGNSDTQNARRSQLGFVSMCGKVPMAWGASRDFISKACRLDVKTLKTNGCLLYTSPSPRD